MLNKLLPLLSLLLVTFCVLPIQAQNVTNQDDTTKKIQQEQQEIIKNFKELPDLNKYIQELNNSPERKKTETDVIKNIIEEGNKSVQQQIPVKPSQDMIKEHINTINQNSQENFYKDWSNSKLNNCVNTCKAMVDRGLLQCQKAKDKVTCHDRVREDFEKCKNKCESQKK